MSFTAPLLIVLCWISSSSASLGSDHLPKAKNVTWTSLNFKTVLQWGPKPSNHSYTVEFSRVGKNRQTNPHCIRSLETVCDLTNDLKDLKAIYTADVLSEHLPGSSSDLLELPFTQSKKFCPYTDTLIGKPEFTIKLDENKIVIHIRDQLTALNRDGNVLTIRDVFKGDLKHKISYYKAGSTGKKEKIVDGDEVAMSELDKGQSYCFSVAAYIPSRKGNKRLGKWSLPKCSPAGGRSLIDEYGLLTIGTAALVIVTLLVIVVIMTVACCCRRTQKGKQVDDSEVIAHV
ncbi:coagulation factor IIIb [Colossoma macropomum]|uniref:coagulation factor IIIb n=1 Tax=Colossoma macropomum TaxID=42526 RepID=UPI0018647C0C|nr:coagulation factor IIIb [Colossoma macropomum]